MESTQGLSDRLTGNLTLADPSKVGGSLLLNSRDHRILHAAGCFEGLESSLHSLATAALNTWRGATELSRCSPESLEIFLSGSKFVLVSGKLLSVVRSQLL